MKEGAGTHPGYGIIRAASFRTQITATTSNNDIELSPQAKSKRADSVDAP